EVELEQEELEVFSAAVDEPLNLSEADHEHELEGEEAAASAAAHEEVYPHEIAQPSFHSSSEAAGEREDHPEEEPMAVAEFDPEEASASYRVDPTAPSEFRF